MSSTHKLGLLDIVEESFMEIHQGGQTDPDNSKGKSKFNLAFLFLDYYA